MTASLTFSADAPWLAPLAGWSDLPFRLLCRELGAAVCCTEMISAKGLVYGSPGTKEILQTSPEDSPVVAQVFGAEAGFMEEAVYRLQALGYVYFDCNMGCSVRKVMRTGAGAAMCANIDNALQVAEALVRAAGRGKTGFKLRLGLDEKGKTAESWRILGPALAELGAGWLTLHPRTARQGFSGMARHEALTELKRMVSVPVIASGDLLTAADGVRCLHETGVDTVMYARGALHNPAIFTEHKMLLSGGDIKFPDVETIVGRIRRHVELARRYLPSRVALLKMRTIVPRYVRGIDDSKRLRLDVISARSWEEFEASLRRFEEEKSI